MEYKYVKVSAEVAAALGKSQYRDVLADGTILLNQKDIMSCDGASFEEQAAKIGGTVLSEEAAIAAKNGVITSNGENHEPESSK